MLTLAPKGILESSCVVITVMDTMGQKTHRPIAIPVSPQSTRVVVAADTFIFPNLTHRNWIYFHVEWLTRDGTVTLGTGCSSPFCIMSERLYHTDQRKGKVMEDITLDTKLIQLSGVGMGYARRFSLAGIHTMRDLATTRISMECLHSQYFMRSEQQVVNMLLADILTKHVPNPCVVMEEINQRLFLDSIGMGGVRMSNNPINLSALEDLQQKARILLGEERAKRVTVGAGDLQPSLSFLVDRTIVGTTPTANQMDFPSLRGSRQAKKRKCEEVKTEDV